MDVLDRLQRQIVSLKEMRDEVTLDMHDNEELGKNVRTALVARVHAEQSSQQTTTNAGITGGAGGTSSTSGAGGTAGARADGNALQERYDAFVGELDRVLRLLQKVSGRLARADNALVALPADAPPHERVSSLSDTTSSFSNENCLLHMYTYMGSKANIARFWPAKSQLF